MDKRKSLWIAILLVFTLLTGSLQLPVLAAAQENQATVTVIGADGVTQVLPATTVPLTANETAAQALTQAVGGANNLQFTDTSYGKMLTGIKGETATGNNYWAFLVNGVSAQIGPNTYIIQNGDKITFQLTDWTKPAQNTVSLKVIDGNSKTITDDSKISFIGTPNAFQLLQAALGPDKVGYTDTQYGKMITSLNGIKADATSYWGFYVNGKMASVGAEGYKLQPGDQISFQLESLQPAPQSGNTDSKTPTTHAAGTVSNDTVQSAINSVSQYVLKSPIDEWEAVALKQAGKTIPGSYLDTVKAAVNAKQGKFSKITDTERYILGIVAAGGDPKNIEGYNLVQAVYNGNVTKQGLIGAAYALVALDSGHFTVPNSAQWTREKLINLLLEKQNADGGWAWDESTNSDLDSTAMILTALAPYKGQADVKAKIDKATAYLEGQKQNSKYDNSTTVAQVIIALSALGLDANSSLITKDGANLVQYLLSFQDKKDGSFSWQSGTASDPYSTEQSLEALAAYQLFAQGKGPLYQLSLEKELPSAANSVKAAAASTANGHALPKTATNMENLLAIGILLIMIGSALYFMQRRRA